MMPNELELGKEHHLKSCVIERIQEGDTEVLTELMTAMNKLIK